MTRFPIFSRTMIIVIPTCAMVPLAGLFAGMVVAAFVIVVVGLTT